MAGQRCLVIGLHEDKGTIEIEADCKGTRETGYSISAHPRPRLRHAANANAAGMLIVLDRERAEKLAAEKGEGYRVVPVEVTTARETWAIEVFRQKFRPERQPEGTNQTLRHNLHSACARATCPRGAGRCTRSGGTRRPVLVPGATIATARGYKKLYAACGLPDEVAARLEQKILDALFRGVEEQHTLASRWIKGESNFADFLDRYQDWFREHLDRCGRITVEELCPVA